MRSIVAILSESGRNRAYTEPSGQLHRKPLASDMEMRAAPLENQFAKKSAFIFHAADPQGIMAATILCLLALTSLLVRLTIGATVPASTIPKCPFRSPGGDLPTYACTDSIDWTGDGYSNSDCIAVIQRFYFVEVSKHRNRQFEFLKRGAKNKTSHPVMQTPRRYTVGQLRTDDRVVVMLLIIG